MLKIAEKRMRAKLPPDFMIDVTPDKELAKLKTDSMGGALGLTGLPIAAGGLLAVRRVAETMNFRIAGVNDGQAFTGNFMMAGSGKRSRQ